MTLLKFYTEMLISQYISRHQRDTQGSVTFHRATCCALRIAKLYVTAAEQPETL